MTRLPGAFASLLIPLLATLFCVAQESVPKWSRFERVLTSSVTYTNPLQEASLQARFISPSGKTNRLDGFWDGTNTWRIRFSPDEPGEWSYSTECSDRSNKGLNGVNGTFRCLPSTASSNALAQHGPIRLSPDRFSFIHADGTPFFWMADTAWSGPMLSTDSEWEDYLSTRSTQRFSAVQFVSTQYRAAPKGDRLNRAAYTGDTRIQINPEFFQNLDRRLDAINNHGLLAVPVLLWANAGREFPKSNPGVALPLDQQVLLARYMIARWQSHFVSWILFGDGDYRGANAARYIQIARKVFPSSPHSLVMLHPGGRHWNLPEFANESWLDVIGYQSGHGNDASSIKWIFDGPPAKDWNSEPHRPFVNLEPPYENHIAYNSTNRINAFTTRRAMYWSLLSAPVAGVSYGGHGVWGWDDGTKPPVDHPTTGIPLPWREALKMEGAGQIKHLVSLFTSLDFQQLRPAPAMLMMQPSTFEPRRHIAAAKSLKGDFALIYIPEDRSVAIWMDQLPPRFQAEWFNPRTGGKTPVVAVVGEKHIEFATPEAGDFVLILKSQTPGPR